MSPSSDPSVSHILFTCIEMVAKHQTRSMRCQSQSKDHRRPSLPYFSEDSVQKAKKNSLKSAQKPLPSTQKDELNFLREITGGRNNRSTEVLRKNLFCESSSSSSESSAAGPAQFMEGIEQTNENGTCEEEKENRPFVRNETSLDLRRPSCTQCDSSSVNGQSEASAATSHLKSEEKTEVIEQHGYAHAGHNNGGGLQLKSTKGHLKRRELEMSLFTRDESLLNNHVRYEQNSTISLACDVNSINV